LRFRRRPRSPAICPSTSPVRDCGDTNPPTNRGDFVMPFRGSCHCGAIAYELAEDLPTQALQCNCSICQRKGYLHLFSTPEKFTLMGNRDELQVYTFNRHAIRHQFCKTCGCAPFAEGTTPDGRSMVEVNLRCVEGIDLAKLAIVPIDGASR
jgi:hypothetical protein